MTEKVHIGELCTIADDVRLGKGVVIHGHANLYGCTLGDDCHVGTFVEIIPCEGIEFLFGESGEIEYVRKAQHGVVELAVFLVSADQG